jgi:Rad3-related DNA helicase
MTQHLITFDNINVYFPYPPYSCQIDFISKILNSLKNKTNALLESPTGTGKTLCLLTSVFAWMNTQMVDDFSVISKSVGSFKKSEESGTSNIKRVYYCSRTHSQLKQVVKELKMTVYRPSMTILGFFLNLKKLKSFRISFSVLYKSTNFKNERKNPRCCLSELLQK